MKNIRLIFSILFLLFFATGNLNGQTYRSSLGLHYGLFQFNNSQNDYFFDADGNFLNAGLSYKYKLGRLSSLSFTGRYYDWNLNDLQTLNTQSLQGMWLIHAGRISSSWRVNLITPYIGAGIGYEMHTLAQNGSDQNFNNFYLPLEAGMYMNLGPRWSLGIFAEYKLDPSTNLKNRLGLTDNYQGVVNSAGVTLSYHFGQRTTDLAVPLVTTNPHLKHPEVAIPEEKPAEIAELLPDTLAESEIIEIEKKEEPAIVPEFIRAFMDTLRIPVVIDLTVKGLDEETGRPMAVAPDSPAEMAKYETKLDSLIRMTSNLSQRIAQLEHTPTAQITERQIHSVQPVVVDQARQPFPVTTQVQPTPVQPAHPQIVDPEPVTDMDAEIFATKNDIEMLRSEIRQMAADNREAMSSLRRDIRVVSIADRRILEDTEEEKPDFTEPVDTIYNQVDTIPEIEVEIAEVVKGAIKYDEPMPELQAVLDSLSAIEKTLAAELELLKKQNLHLMEELAQVEKTIQEDLIAQDEKMTMEYSVTFGVNSARISDEHLNEIARFAGVMKENPELRIQLSGYADGTGDPEYNKLLSQWRVQAVRDELMKQGVPQARILEQYFGSEGATGGLNPEERRVDIQIL